MPEKTYNHSQIELKWHARWENATFYKAEKHSILPKYSVLGEIASGALTVLFPRLQLLEDSFAIYQKLTRVERPANKLVTGFLLGIDVREFGDAMGHED